MSKSLEQYGYDTSSFQLLCENPSKYLFPIQRRNQSTTLPVKAIVCVSVGEVDGITEESLLGIKAFQFLKRYTFRHSLVAPLQVDAAYFRLCAFLANNIPLFHITRPSGLANIDFSNYLITRFKSLS